MGFHLRKSFNLGPLRLNLSNSGIGFSTGIKGFRVGVDSKGRSYVGGGVGMLRYREYLDNKTDINFKYSTLTHTSDKIHKDDIPAELKISNFLLTLMVIDSLLIILLLWASFTTSTSGDVLVFNLILCAILALPFLAFNRARRASIFDTAKIFFNEKNYKLALKFFLMLNPKLKKLKWSTRAYVANKIYECYIGLDDIQGAIKFLQNNDDIYKKNDKLFKLYYQTARFEDIISYYKKYDYLISTQNNTNETFSIIFKSFWNMGMYKEALEFAQKNPNLPNRIEHILGCYKALEDYQNIINFIQKKLSNNEKENHPKYYAILGLAFLKLGQNEIALETLLSGPVKKRNMNAEMCAFRYALGECYEANNDITSALKQYQKIYAFDMTYEDVADKIEKLSKK